MKREAERARLSPPRRGRCPCDDERHERPPCALCDGDGDACHPGNADPHRKVSDWLPPVVCPRCGGSGKDPNP